MQETTPRYTPRPRLTQLLEEGLAELDAGDDPGLPHRLAAYLGLLARWNEAYNLTAVRSPEDMVSRHVMDSLSILPFIGEGRVLDVGTGAGLPGLALAMARPAQPFVLLDSLGKKTRFVRHAAAHLRLDNVTVVRARAEEHRDTDGFGAVVSRAFASIADFLRLAGHLAGEGGRLLAMKGEFPAAELDAVPAGWTLAGAHRLDVPGLDAQRHLLEFVRGVPGR